MLVIKKIRQQIVDTEFVKTFIERDRSTDRVCRVEKFYGSGSHECFFLSELDFHAIGKAMGWIKAK